MMANKEKSDSVIGLDSISPCEEPCETSDAHV